MYSDTEIWIIGLTLGLWLITFLVSSSWNCKYQMDSKNRIWRRSFRQQQANPRFPGCPPLLLVMSINEGNLLRLQTRPEAPTLPGCWTPWLESLQASETHKHLQMSERTKRRLYNDQDKCLLWYILPCPCCYSDFWQHHLARDNWSIGYILETRPTLRHRRISA